jgi:small ligand-binding sensory domain FIST
MLPSEPAVPDPRAASGSGSGPDALAAVDAALRSIQATLGTADSIAPIDLAVVFLGGAHADQAEAVSATLMSRLRPRHLLGVTAAGVVSDAVELERADGVSVWAARLPGAVLTPLRYEPVDQDNPEPAAWQSPPPDARALLLLADPFTLPADALLAWLQQAAPGVPISGGLASAGRAAGENRLFLDGEITADGAVGIAISGEVEVRTLVSQGCRPIGRSFVVTRAERNLVQELGGASPVERIRQTFSAAEQADRNLMRQGLHIGMLIDEYVEEPTRGDFLVRGVMGAQAGTGALAIGDVVEVGQTVRFHVRDAASADEDLREMLAQIPAADPVGALLFTCNGRGSRLFGEPDHDAEAVRAALGDIPVAGFFCAGEFGPVGHRSFLHGFTASLLVLSPVTSP